VIFRNVSCRVAWSAASILALSLFGAAGGCGGSTFSTEPGDDAGRGGADDGGSDGPHVCPAIACGDVYCPNGYRVDAHGCNTCQCAPADGGTCVTSAQCGAGYQCGFPNADACTAVGACFPDPGVHCELYSPGCACDETTINVGCTGLPAGYSPAPLLHAGACAGPSQDAGLDAGPAKDGGKSCTSDADCGLGICGFPTADMCAAKGTCFPPPGAVCAAYSPGCACDGTTTNVICNGLPSGYAPKPLRHAGMCGADGG
jgi:hypothetical protein